MVFSSVIFVFLFLPVVLTSYLFMPRHARNVWLLLASLFFYAWGETFFVFVMLASILANYLVGLWMNAAGPGSSRKLGLALGIVANLSLLGSFKYANFLVDNVNLLLSPLGVVPLELAPVHLPIGISFFTFQSMSYIIDVYRDDAHAQKNPINLALYISLFPQLIAGPIVRYQHIAEQLLKRTITLDGMAYGVRRFIIGLGKKMLLANTFAVPADEIFGLPSGQLTPALAWLGIVCFTLQVYFDFSGYSDMAIGLGRILGFRFLENFQWPYISQSIREYWRRWHISLSTWFRDYLYFPLGGNRKGTLRTYFNLVTVFLLCGLWHGASWNFVIFGLYHGLFLVLERTRFRGWLAARWRPLRHAYFWLVLMVSLVIFRAETLPGAFNHLGAMFGLVSGHGALRPVGAYMRGDILLALAFGLVGMTPLLPAIERWRDRAAEKATTVNRIFSGGLTLASFAGCIAVFLLCTVVLSSGTHNPFIYFRF